MMSWMCSRSRSTRRGVKACEARPRMRVCEGASRKSIWRTITRATGVSVSRPSAASCSGVGVRLAEKRWSTVTTSA